LNANVLEFLTLAVPAPMQTKLSEACTLPCTCRDVVLCIVSWQEDTVSYHDRFVVLG